MTKPRLMAGASTRSFAGLLGLPARSAKGKTEGEGDAPTKPPKKDDEAGAVSAEQAPDTDDDGKAQCAVCEGTGTDEDGDKCEACDGTGEVGEGDDVRRDPPDASVEDDDKEAKGRKAERTRWSRVLSHPAAGGGRAALACHLLSTTDMKASGVIASLSDTPVAAARSAGDTLYSRMNGDSRPPNPGASGGKAAPTDFGSMVAAAVEKVRPKASQ